MLCYAMLWYAVLCYAMLCYAIMLCYAMLCYAMLCYAIMLCYAMLCYAIMLCYYASNQSTSICLHNNLISPIKLKIQCNQCLMWTKPYFYINQSSTIFLTQRQQRSKHMHMNNLRSYMTTGITGYEQYLARSSAGITSSNLQENECASTAAEDFEAGNIFKKQNKILNIKCSFIV